MADNNLLWLSSSPNYKTEAWSLSCLVSEHISMAAQANTATGGTVKEMNNNSEAAAEVMNTEYLSVSSRGSVTEDVVDPVSTGRSKRKRGNPWSEDEHRQFLQGLQLHGKGKWKKISRDFVKTRSPVQVASHAQKFFDRHNSSKPKKRKSINDITSLPAAETLIQPTQKNPNPCSSTYHLPPLPDHIFSQTHHIFGNGNHLVTTATTADQENKMHLPCNAIYHPPMLLPQPPDQGPVITYPNVNVNVAPLTDQDLMVPQVVDGCSMMEPQFHPSYRSPFPIIDQVFDHLSVPTLIDGDHIDLSVFEDLVPPL